MPDAIDKLVTRWREGDAAAPGASPEKSDRFERDFGLRLPADFRKLYSLCNGMADYDSDLDSLSLWSLERIREEGVWHHLEAERVYACFAYAMISAPQFALRLPQSGAPDIVAVWDTFDVTLHKPVAGSTTEFCERHLAKRLPEVFYG